MISTSFAVDQIARLMGMVGFPRGKESQKYVEEMYKAVQSARSEVVAERAVTDMLWEFKRCPAVADIYEAMSEENARGLDEPVFAAQHHRCARCQDCGHYGGHLPPHPYAGPWKWCDCIAGRERQEREPNLVDEANANRDKLIARFASATFRGIKRNTGPDPMTPLVDEIYFGEF